MRRGEIALEGGTLTEESVEVARLWVTDGGGSSIWIDASLFEDPRVFGYLLADAARHGAKAYAAAWEVEENAALQAIVDGLGDELREQFGEIEAVADGKVN